MTFLQWVNSVYNVDGYIIENEILYNSTKTKKSSSKIGNNKITSGSNFTLTAVSGGGSAAGHAVPQ